MADTLGVWVWTTQSVGSSYACSLAISHIDDGLFDLTVSASYCGATAKIEYLGWPC